MEFLYIKKKAYHEAGQASLYRYAYRYPGTGTGVLVLKYAVLEKGCGLQLRLS